MYAHNLDTVVYFCLAAQKHLIGNNAGVFLVSFFPIALACPVRTSIPHYSATQVLQRLDIFVASRLMISHKIKVCSKQTLEI